ncbi:MAG: YraN family protein [Armatimonadetes bacterium]|nr:YraN family protein [Armatimonadota bacterium]
MNTRRDIGARGEDRALALLQKEGYRLRERNYRTRLGEIDLVAEEGEYLVFVEVKTRTGLDRGLPREAVDTRKQRRLVRAAYHYLNAHPEEARPCRFDVVEVTFIGSGAPEVHVIRDAFQPREEDAVW